MSGFYENLQSGATGDGRPYLRDYVHASKTFRTNSYQNAPKFKYLFHTEFDINLAAYSPDSSYNSNFGLLVRDIKLPSFRFDTKELNQYNRKRIVQSKIKYEPVTITCHDDNGNLINKLWVAYYRYYYQDGGNPSVIFNGARGSTPNFGIASPTNIPLTARQYNNRNLYDEASAVAGQTSWGYRPDGSEISDGILNRKVPFFKNITVFGFNQHNFTAYTLINPIITNFSHDTYSYDGGNEVMKNTMTIDYETVVYNEGSIDGGNPSNIIKTFGLNEYYDREISPITTPGGNRKALGQGGLVDASGGFMLNTSRSTQELMNSGLSTAEIYDNTKFPNLTTDLSLEYNQMLSDTLSNTPTNRNVGFSFPRAGGTPSIYGTAGAPTTGVQLQITPDAPTTAGTQT